MQKLKIKAEKRKIFGRKVKSLRTQGKVPANIYGKEFKSTAIVLDKKEFEKIFKDAGETSVVDVFLGSKSIPTLIHSVQTDPVADTLIHVDFRKVDLTKKVTANIPVEIVGESPAEKQGLGTLVQVLDEVEVEALPGNLPEKFEVKANKLTEVDAAVLVGALKAGDKVKMLTDPEQLIVKVEAMREEEAEPEPAEQEAVEEHGQEEKEEETSKEDKDEDKNQDAKEQKEDENSSK